MENGWQGGRETCRSPAEVEEAWPEVGKAEVEKGWILEVDGPGRSSGLGMCLCEKGRNEDSLLGFWFEPLDAQWNTLTEMIWAKVKESFA